MLPNHALCQYSGQNRIRDHHRLIARLIFVHEALLCMTGRASLG
jgi:hypothetical protein